jgi:hypothetical protein
MASPRRFSLNYNTQTEKWELRNEQNARLLRSYWSKEAATRAGVLEREIGSEGGSVVIRKKGGVFEEERRFGGRR